MELTRYIGATANFEQLLSEIETSLGTNLYGPDGEASVMGATGIFDFTVGLTAGQITTLDSTISSHVGSTAWEAPCHRICDDVSNVIAEKPIYAINYKTELEPEIIYTPVFIIGDVGATAGLLERTEYYRDFVDNDNKGTIVLQVEETYIIDDSEVGADHTRKPVLSRTKTWKYYMDDGTIDETVSKSKTKLYNTRTKRHKEGVKRRTNVIEQLIDNVGTAGILAAMAGATAGFTSEEDAHVKLTLLQERDADEFSSWTTSGLGSLTSVVTNDNDTDWLDLVIPDFAHTQALVPWMIGLTLRYYIVEKLKGNIK